MEINTSKFYIKKIVFTGLLLVLSNLAFATTNQKNDSTINENSSIYNLDTTCGANIRTIFITPQLNPGFITSFDQAIAGKVAGVQISTNNGSILSGSSIQIRGISSIMNSNKTLLVVDGVPLETDYVSSNLATILNPEDIQEISILKDVAATGIYGTRGSGGAIEIKTKRGETDKLKINFSTTNAIQQVSRTLDVLSATDFRNLVNTQGSDAEKALLGNASTNWNNEIFETALATNNQISITGKFGNKVPFRASVGYINQDGTLRTEHLEQINGSLGINPSFFDNHLNVSINLRGSSNNNQIANVKANGAAASMNPTVPVRSIDPVFVDNFGGYWQSYLPSGENVYPNSFAISNPLALLLQNNDNQKSTNILTNIGIDYKFHFFKDFHIFMNYSDYISNIIENQTIPSNSPRYFLHGFILNHTQLFSIENNQIGFKYNKYFNKHTILTSVTYDWRHNQNSFKFSSSGIDGYDSISLPSKTESYFTSFLGQIQYNYAQKYYFTFNYTLDGSSQFSVSNRWINSQSIGLAWNATNEGFLKDDHINQLKVRVSYGINGQQPNSQSSSSIYNSNLKWETSKKLNYGIDFGLYGNRVTGSIDFYNNTTDDLLNILKGNSNYGYPTLMINKGSLISNGGELTINLIPVLTEKIVWSLSFNAAYQNTIIKNLDLTYFNDLSFYGVQSITTDGYAPNMFYAYKQKYDNNGKPIEGSFYDLNADGKISNSDMYAYHSPTPDCLFGLNSILTYEKWDFGISFRASIGNYVYNQINAALGYFQQPASMGYLKNISTDYLNTGFKTYQGVSDYYVENASFLKLDYLNVGYNFGKISKGVNLKITATVQNVFTVTGYKGVDPEIPGGVDSGFYPRPRIFSIKLNLDF